MSVSNNNAANAVEARSLRSTTTQATEQSKVAAAKGESNVVVAKSGILESIKSAISSVASYFTPRVNVISFNGDLQEKFDSIGLKLGAKKLTIVDKAVDIESDDDEDYSPPATPTDVEFEGEINKTEVDALNNDIAQPLSNKTKMIMGAVAVVAAIAFIYIGRNYFADTSALKDCIANNTIIKDTFDSMKETAKSAAYDNGLKDGQIMCNMTLHDIDGVADVQLHGEEQKSLLTAMFPYFWKNVADREQG